MDKMILTTSDFEQMLWHDCKIYAISFDEVNFQLSFDIDYIHSWISPTEREPYYKFMVSPALLVFENVWDLEISIAPDLNLDIDAISKSNPNTPKNAAILNGEMEYEWIIQLRQGDISFKSIGYKLLIREDPILLERQSLGLLERKGVNLNWQFRSYPPSY